MRSSKGGRRGSPRCMLSIKRGHGTRAGSGSESGGMCVCGGGGRRHPAAAPLTKAWHCWVQEGWRSWLRVVTHPVDSSCLRRDGVCLSSPHVEPGPFPWAFHVQDFACTLLQELKWTELKFLPHSLKEDWQHRDKINTVRRSDLRE